MVIDYMIYNNAAFEKIQSGDGVKWGGQGELFGFIFTFLFAIIFIIAMILNALLRKTKPGFYWWMCLLIAFNLSVVIGASYLLNAD
jgi:ribose/xylose/arabinose/galactoside ABC-type transport system permease subunit